MGRFPVRPDGLLMLEALLKESTPDKCQETFLFNSSHYRILKSKFVLNAFAYIKKTNMVSVSSFLLKCSIYHMSLN